MGGPPRLSLGIPLGMAVVEKACGAAAERGVAAEGAAAGAAAEGAEAGGGAALRRAEVIDSSSATPGIS